MSSISGQDTRGSWFIDPQVQKAIAWKVVTYWAAALLFMILPLALYRSIVSPEKNFVMQVIEVITSHWPVIVTMSLLLPFAIFDVIRFSNRFVGPVFRLRKELEGFEESGKINHLEFRENDYWSELSDGINSLAGRINDLEVQVEDELQRDDSIV